MQRSCKCQFCSLALSRSQLSFINIYYPGICTLIYTFEEQFYWIITYLCTWYTKSKWTTVILHTINSSRACDGTSVSCMQIIFSYILCCLIDWETPSFIMIVYVTSCSVPLVDGEGSTIHVRVTLLNMG